MWIKNIQLYRLPAPWACTAEQLAAALAPHQHADIGSMDLLRTGWATPREGGPLVHGVNRQYLLRLRTDKKLLPASVINAEVKVRAAALEEQQGFAPGKKAIKELKERVADELLPRAFPVATNTWVWIDSVNGWLAVDTPSTARADEVVKMLLKAVDKLPLESLRVQRSPVAVMTEWLQEDNAPAGFTVDMDATLCATGESRAQVAYKKHTLEADDVRRHIAAGKQCTRLAMTWNDRISFVLDESLAIKSIKALDVITERAPARDDEERFDGDLTLMTGELAKMMADIVEALGGEAIVETGEAAPRATETTGTSDVQAKHERAVGQLAELYKGRARYREVLNDLYAETIQPYVARVREHMAATGEGAIKAALGLANAAPAGSDASKLFLVAAVEIMEPSPATPAGAGRARGVLAQVGAGGVS